MKRQALAVFLLFAALAPFSAAHAESGGSGDVCAVVQKAIAGGMDEERVVTTSIELGHSACLVVKCAIMAGGDVRKIIKGAMAAGTTVDVVSKCAVLGGAEPLQVSAAIDMEGAGPALCYIPPDEGGEGDVYVGSIYEPPAESISPSIF
jgi:hypothetical protein